MIDEQALRELVLRIANLEAQVAQLGTLVRQYEKAEDTEANDG